MLRRSDASCPAPSLTGAERTTQQQWIENRTFDELAVGDRASVPRQLTREDILLFAKLSGDVDPALLRECGLLGAGCGGVIGGSP